MSRFTKEDIFSLFLAKQQFTEDDVASLIHSSFDDLHDPSLLTGSLEFIQQLHAVRDLPIAIVPDYDADGVGSGITLLAGLSVIGTQHPPYLYRPRTDTGYGLSEWAIDEILRDAPDTQVIITTDNGIKAYDAIAYAKEKGLKVLVSDHHLGADDEPIADAIVNPNRVHDTYPFKSISGTVVIWKLLVHYAQTYLPREKLQQMYNLIVFSGITTISDVMKLLDENRYIVRVALNMLKERDYLRTESHRDEQAYAQAFRGLWALMSTLDGESKLNYGVDEDTIGFYVSPILNSPRRMSGASALAFDLFTAESNNEALDAAMVLFELNEERKAEVKTVADAIAKEASTGSMGHALITTANTRGGFAGLIAGKLTNLLDLPSIVFSKLDGDVAGAIIPEDVISSYAAKGGVLHGSGRSPQWFDLYKALHAVNDIDSTIFASFGGHAQAAGVAVYAEKYPLFIELMTNLVTTALVEKQGTDGSTGHGFTDRTIVVSFENNPYMVQPDVQVNDSIDMHELLLSVPLMNALRPFGEGFRAPLFGTIVSLADVAVSYMGQEKQHIKFVLPNGLVIIQWNGSSMVTAVNPDQYLTVSGKLSINEFRGKQTLQLIADDLRIN